MPLEDSLNVRVDAQIRAGLEAIRERAGPDVTLADIVRRALREFIAREAGEDPRLGEVVLRSCDREPGELVAVPVFELGETPDRDVAPEPVTRALARAVKRAASRAVHAPVVPGHSYRTPKVSLAIIAPTASTARS